MDPRGRHGPGVHAVRDLTGTSAALDRPCDRAKTTERGRPMRLVVRQKLVILGALIIVGVSFGFLTLNLWLASRWVEEDVRARVVAFARAMAATISSRHEFESGPVLQAQAGDIRAAREDLLQLDVLAF